MSEAEMVRFLEEFSKDMNNLKYEWHDLSIPFIIDVINTHLYELGYVAVPLNPEEKFDFGKVMKKLSKLGERLQKEPDLLAS